MAVTETFTKTIVASEFGTNTFTLGPQLAPDTLGLTNGGFVTAYNNTSLTSGLILLDFYDANFDSVGAASIPFDDDATTDAAGEPSVTQLANGNVLVVWDEQNDTGSQAGMKAALFTQTGTLIDAGIDLSSGGIAFKDLDVTALSNGNFAVSFAFGSFEMFRLYTAEGVAIGGAHAMNQLTAGTQTNAQIMALAGGGFVAVWTDLDTRNVEARIYEDDGQARTDQFAVAGFAGKSQPALAALPDGNWAVVYRDIAWSEPGTDGAGITLQVFTPDGGDFGLVQVTDESPTDESDPDVTALANGFVLVSWSRPTGSGNTDIIGRLFDQRGFPVEIAGDDREFVITSSASDDTLSSVSRLLAGQFITSWQDSFTVDGSAGRITSEIAEIFRTTIGDDARNGLVGDALRDVMDGAKGADTLDGAGGDDSLAGGEGADSLLGGAGNDTLDGGAKLDTLDGGDGDDRLIAGPSAPGPVGFADRESILGGAGDDTIVAASANDTLEGGDGADLIDGAAGRDVIRGGAGSDTINGGDGNDLIFAALSAFGVGEGTLPNVLNGDGGDDFLDGEAGSDTLNGGDGDDNLQGRGGADVLNGGDGQDEVSYLGFNAVTVNLLTGLGSGNDAQGDVYTSIENVIGSGTGDRLIGNAANNELDGNVGNDTLEGGDGRDTLDGGNVGSDVLTGGKERDILIGDINDDRFVYLSTRDSTTDKADLITDFSHAENDRIDLSAIDARTGGKDNAFVLVGAFTGAAGQLIAPTIGANRFLVQGDVDGDGLADFAIEVVSVTVLAAADFVP